MKIVEVFQCDSDEKGGFLRVGQDETYLRLSSVAPTVEAIT